MTTIKIGKLIAVGVPGPAIEIQNSAARIEVGEAYMSGNDQDFSAPNGVEKLAIGTAEFDERQYTPDEARRLIDEGIFPSSPTGDDSNKGEGTRPKNYFSGYSFGKGDNIK